MSGIALAAKSCQKILTFSGNFLFYELHAYIYICILEYVEVGFFVSIFDDFKLKTVNLRFEQTKIHRYIRTINVYMEVYFHFKASCKSLFTFVKREVEL